MNPAGKRIACSRLYVLDTYICWNDIKEQVMKIKLSAKIANLLITAVWLILITA